MKKGYISILVVAVLISTSAITVSAVNNYHYDVNNDSSVNVIDILDLKREVLNNETFTTSSIDTTSTTVQNTTVSTNKSSTTVLDDNTKINVEEKYKILAKEYIQEYAPSMYDYIQDISVELYNYDNLAVVTSTELTVTSVYSTNWDGSIYYTDENRAYYSIMEDGSTYYNGAVATTRVTTTTTIKKNIYDACITVMFSKDISEDEKDIFLNAWLYSRNYVNLYFVNGKVSKVD